MIDRILAKRIVPVVVLDRVESAEPLAEALLAGGLDIMEITFRTPAAAAPIELIAANFPEILLGAGTLLEKDQVKRANDAGAVLGLAPGFNPEIVAAAKDVGLLFAPGAMAPSGLEGLHRKTNARLIEIAVGYFPPVLGGDYAVPPALGQQAGICGDCLLAISA